MNKGTWKNRTKILKIKKTKKNSTSHESPKYFLENPPYKTSNFVPRITQFWPFHQKNDLDQKFHHAKANNSIDDFKSNFLIDNVLGVIIVNRFNYKITVCITFVYIFGLTFIQVQTNKLDACSKDWSRDWALMRDSLTRAMSSAKSGVDGAP